MLFKSKKNRKNNLTRKGRITALRKETIADFEKECKGILRAYPTIRKEDDVYADKQIPFVLKEWREAMEEIKADELALREKQYNHDLEEMASLMNQKESLKAKLVEINRFREEHDYENGETYGEFDAASELSEQDNSGGYRTDDTQSTVDYTEGTKS